MSNPNAKQEELMGILSLFEDDRMWLIRNWYNQDHEMPVAQVFAGIRARVKRVLELMKDLHPQGAVQPNWPSKEEAEKLFFSDPC